MQFRKEKNIKMVHCLMMGMIMIQMVVCAFGLNLSMVRDESSRNAIQKTWSMLSMGATKKCCLPDTYSMSMINSRSGNNNDQRLKGISVVDIENSKTQTWYDKKSFRMRVDNEGVDSRGFSLKTSQFTFRLGSNDYEYNIVNGSCSCRLTKLMWDKTCYTLEGSSSVGKIGQFEARNVFVKSPSNEFYLSQWTLRSEQMPTDTCLPLSVEFVHGSTNLIQSAYNQETKVDPTSFRLPNNCPVFSSCK